MRLQCLDTIIDTVGWSGDAACAESSFASRPLGTDESHRRRDRETCSVDTDENFADFDWDVSPSIDPRNRASAAGGCSDPLLFSDGFESGDVEAWSAATPP